MDGRKKGMLIMLQEGKQSAKRVVSVAQLMEVLSVLRVDDQLRFNNSNIVSILRNGSIVGILDINSLSSAPVEQDRLQALQ